MDKLPEIYHLSPIITSQQYEHIVNYKELDIGISGLSCSCFKIEEINSFNSRFCADTYNMSHFYLIRIYSEQKMNYFSPLYEFRFPFVEFTMPPRNIKMAILKAFKIIT